MTELHDFYNHGYGWICRHCDRELSPEPTAGHARFFREGEAEGKSSPKLSTQALARWADPEQKTLFCPRCGITEVVDVS